MDVFSPFQIHFLIIFLFVTRNYYLISAEIEKDKTGKILYVPALGRVAQLGELYNAKTNEFLGSSIWAYKMDKSIVNTDTNPKLRRTYKTSTKITDVFSILNIGADIAITILSGLASLSGAAEFITSTIDKASSIYGSLVQSTTTVFESFDPELAPTVASYSNSSIYHHTATHFVFSRRRGSDFNLKFQELSSEKKTDEELRGNLQAAISMLSFSVTGGASVDYQKGDKNLDSSFEIDVFGDVPATIKTPSTLHEIANFSANMHQVISQVNNGTGALMEYRVFPLITIQVSKGSTNIMNGIKSLSAVTSRLIFLALNEYYSMKRIMDDFVEQVYSYSGLFPFRRFFNILQMQKRFELEFARFQENMTGSIEQYKNGTVNDTFLQQIIHAYEDISNANSPVMIRQNLNKDYHQSFLYQIEFAKLAASKGIHFVSTYEEFQIIKINPNTSTFAVLYYKQDWILDHHKDWTLHSAKFLELAEGKWTIPKYLVNCETTPNSCGGVTKIGIDLFTKGALIIQNLHQYLKNAQVQRLGRRASELIYPYTTYYMTPVDVRIEEINGMYPYDTIPYNISTKHHENHFVLIY